MIITTTSSVEGRAIAQYLGVIAAEATVGVNALTAHIRNFIGGRSVAYEKELGKARLIAFDGINDKARQLGAEAVVGVSIGYDVIGNVLMVSVCGTAVVLQ